MACQWLESFPTVTGSAFATVGIAVGWPFSAPGATVRQSDITSLADHWSNLLSGILGVVFAVVVWEYVRKQGTQVFTTRALLLGMVLYAVFLVGPSTTWLLLPVPLIAAALLAVGWMFKGEDEREALQALQASAASGGERQVRDYVEAHAVRTDIEAAIASLHSQFQKGLVTPDKFSKRLDMYREFGEKSSDRTSEATNRLFALGVRDFPQNVLAFITMGLLLASIPLAISLYQYLPVSRVDYPYPIAGFLVFVALATLKWGLFAGFFGLLYPNLKGDTGLTKGLYFFVALAVPSGIPYLLGAAGLESIRPYALSLAQLFIFCSLLGLLGSDLRLLRKAGLDVRSLRAVHRMPVLSAFASSIAAALVPTVLSVLAGQANEVVKVFIGLVNPSAK